MFDSTMLQYGGQDAAVPRSIPTRPGTEACRAGVGAQAGETGSPAFRRPEHDLDVLGVESDCGLDDLPLEELDQVLHVHLPSQQLRLVQDEVLG